MGTFVTILLLLVVGFLVFCVYMIFKFVQYIFQALNCYKDMITRQDTMIKLLKDIRDNGPSENRTVDGAVPETVGGNIPENNDEAVGENIYCANCGQQATKDKVGTECPNCQSILS